MKTSIAKYQIIARDIIVTIAFFYMGFDLATCDYNTDKYLIIIYAVISGLIVFFFKYKADKKKDKRKI